MSDYTPTTEEVRASWVEFGKGPFTRQQIIDSRAEFDRWKDEFAREVAEKAWDEGHKTRWRRDPDDGCTCGAWAEIECGCGNYGTGELLSLNDNPYREGKSDE